MADRQARLITKRTSVPGKIPTGTTGSETNLIQSGELASNLSDKKLYGYDGTNVFEYGSNSFLGLTGGTVSGTINATTFSGGTFYGDGSNLTGITIPAGYWTAGTGTDSIVSLNQGHIGSGNNSFIGGGLSNSATTIHSSVVGGQSNLASGSASFIGGGYGNSSSFYYSSVVGGLNNVSSGAGSFIGGGQSNLVSGVKSAVVCGDSNQTTGYYSFIGSGSGNLASGNYSAVIAGSGNTISGQRSIILGGQNITGSADDTAYVPYLNIGSLSATTSATTYDNIVVDSNGSVMTNKLFYIGVNFETTGVTWTYVSPETFQINSIDNPSGLTYTTLVNGSSYTLGNTINLYDSLQISGITQTGFLKLNSELV